ncbi:alpha-d-galacturonidase [Microbacter margulisiae]|uniref:Beta-hexosaminidase bacterial type N-terminal domain-containing protein n=1 Tax=Microbacter margulisiae TaxID=1350067 RepID=A0A7W5DQ56_9PORP|nr:hypothetical protein [Microbacter margulisiae]MBB3187017.1 hypothetical protein [Microbacter margulisiae]
MKIKISIFFWLCFFTTAIYAQQVNIITHGKSSVCATFGIHWLTKTLQTDGFKVNQTTVLKKHTTGTTIVIGTMTDKWLEQFIAGKKVVFEKTPGKEGYSIKALGKLIIVQGADTSGTLYGCVELADKIRASHRLPTSMDITDQPEMVMRGACIGLQKPYLLPGHGVYEYPYTPQNFPWFYDKALWIKYLNMMVENRMNTLYLWNGHPFASLVKLKDYPFAVEVDNQTLKKNQEMFAFLTREAQKRNIWVIQMFYNIIVSKPFAEHYGIRTQDRNRPITPLISDYTRKSIAAFIKQYPHVGLLVCLGESIDSYPDGVKWFTQTIIPGVKDGLKALGRTDEPPIILRAHDTDAKTDMQEALPLYKNLYTMWKYNGESLTTYNPRGPWAKEHLELSKLGPVHIVNVHILANLEPFRYGAPDFIQKCVQAMHSKLGANGIHIYPQASYWDWPYTADNTHPRLLEMNRDWIWYAAWARYAWNANRNPKDEVHYWSYRLDTLYGCGLDAAKNILEAYEQAGEISPELTRKFAITDGNRQTFLLGMFMSQLVNPKKWTIYPDFFKSCGPKGEVLTEYMDKEWNHQLHTGELPPQLIAGAVIQGAKAVQAIDSAAPHVTHNKAEFERLKNDMYCYNTFANYFNQKVKAAMLVLRYSHSNDIKDLEAAVPYLEKSLQYYRHLVALTENTYLYANSMQTSQRRIPIGGGGGKNKTWKEMLPYFETELQNFKRNVAYLQEHGNTILSDTTVLKPANVKLSDKNLQTYSLAKGAKIFGDKNLVIDTVANELRDLKAIQFDLKHQMADGTSFTFESNHPVSVLVGYFNSERNEFAKPPKLETDANANDFGQADVKIANALEVHGQLSVNVHTYTFPSGIHTLSLGKGALMVLGFINASQKITFHDDGMGSNTKTRNIDWLFY